MIRKSLCALFLVFVPILLAQGYIRPVKDKLNESICTTYNRGCIYMLFLSTLVFVLCRLNQWKFIVYERMLIFFVAFISITMFLIKVRRKKKYLSKPKVERISLLLVVALMIIFQISAYLFTGSFEKNDNTVEIVNTILSNDSFFYVNPYIGDKGIFIQSSYTPIMLFYAFLSKISGLHPTLLIHIIIPLWILILFSSICYEYGLELFENRRKAAFLVLVIQVLNIFGTHGKWLISSLLLYDTWQGENILLTCLLPWLMLQIFRMFQTVVKAGDWLLLILQSILIILFERSGVFYIGLLLAITFMLVIGRKVYGRYRAF